MDYISASNTINFTSVTKENPMVISYLGLRKAVGILGIAFPVILVLGVFIIGKDDTFQKSISMYYHTHMRDAFVGILCAVALFLFSYTGYSWVDNLCGNLAAIFALGVAFCPCPNPQFTIVGVIHLISALLFFLTLTYFSLFLFTKSKPKPTARKKQRNIVYRVCGFIMLGCVIAIVVYFFLPLDVKSKLEALHYVFWFETIALWAFGTSWLVKGEFLLKD